MYDIDYAIWNSFRELFRINEDAVDVADESDICLRKGHTYLMLTPYLGDIPHFKNTWNISVYTTNSAVVNMKHILTLVLYAHTNYGIKRLHLNPTTKHWRLFRKVFKADVNNNIDVSEENLKKLKEML